ncbi:hypothetical protein TPY_3207 [Sulfobacillus acidophilus TPY]|uniref:Uncharacterized protein n=1 Tax=Sulfobacillus acidophilus (strain ATCC 700253 / DSM 10332 / NAL) TaxID=679936 RepID=G8TZG2_SULAD|nr:hypothetical protein TPY_3207 [Sulfobacillus acidophilus TPY]AEW05202.1 hypothetical protein Sulac_1706 [Sulfobacillus acidophilus DSM 10332]
MEIFEAGFLGDGWKVVWDKSKAKYRIVEENWSSGYRSVEFNEKEFRKLWGAMGDLIKAREAGEV